MKNQNKNHHQHHTTQKSSRYEPDPTKLIKFLESSPKWEKQCQEELMKIKLGKNHLPAPGYSKIIKGIQQALNLLVTFIFCRSQRDILENTIPTPSLKKAAQRVANWNNLSNWSDWFLNLVFWLAVYKSIPVLALIINTAILSIPTNALSWAASGTRENRLKSLGGFLILIGGNVLQTGISVVGAIILIGGADIAEYKATQIYQYQTTTAVDEAVANLDDNLDERIEEARKECEELKRELNTIPRRLPDGTSNPEFDRKFPRAWGFWNQQGEDWTKYELNQVPKCHKEAVLQKRHELNRAKVIESIRPLLENKAAYATNLELLKNHLPGVYNVTFDKDGDFKSGIQLAQTAYEFFCKSLEDGNYAAVYLALIFLVFSIITSVGACWTLANLVNSSEFLQASDPRKIAHAHNYAERMVRKANENL